MTGHLLTLCIALVLSVSTAIAAEPQKYSSKDAALAALTSRSPSNGKAGEDDEVEEIPVDAPTTSNVRSNTPVAGETGQL